MFGLFKKRTPANSLGHVSLADIQPTRSDGIDPREFTGGEGALINGAFLLIKIRLGEVHPDLGEAWDCCWPWFNESIGNKPLAQCAMIRSFYDGLERSISVRTGEGHQLAHRIGAMTAQCAEPEMMRGLADQCRSVRSIHHALRDRIDELNPQER